MLKELNPIGITLTGGDEVHKTGREWSIPKRDLIASLISAFQSGTFNIARSLPEAKTLIKKLMNFRMSINTVTSHDSNEAGREDTGFSVATCVYCAQKAIVGNMTSYSVDTILHEDRKYGE